MNITPGLFHKTIASGETIVLAGGELRDGVTPGESCRRLAKAGAEVVGTNCSRGPDALEAQVTNRHEMRDFARPAKSKGLQLNYPDARPNEASDQAHSRG